MKKLTSLWHSTGLVSGMTLVSRVLGFVRDMVIAHLFGATAGVDAFLVAFKIPNFMRRLFAEGAFSQAFVPVLSEYRVREPAHVVRQFVNRVGGHLSLCLLVFVAIAIWATPGFIHLFAPGFHPQGARFLLATHMLRITFPYLLLISLVALSGAILNTYGYFAVPAFTPVLLNLSFILLAFYLAPHLAHPIMALAWAVLLAGLLQVLFQLPFLSRLSLLPTLQICWADKGVRQVMRLMLPAMFGASVSQLNLLVDTWFASFLPIGSVSWLYYSDRLNNFPLGVFGVAVATVILPRLAQYHAERDEDSFIHALDWGVRMISWMALPAAIGLGVLAAPVLTSLFAYGHFTAYDVGQSQMSLQAFAFGLPAFMLLKIFTSAFYAQKDIKTPVRIAVFVVGINIGLNLILIKPLAHVGIALATSLAAWVNVVSLGWCLHRRQCFKQGLSYVKYLLRLGIANVAMFAYLYHWHSTGWPWMQWPWYYRMAHLFALIISAIGVYLVVLLLVGWRWPTSRQEA